MAYFINSAYLTAIINIYESSNHIYHIAPLSSVYTTANQQFIPFRPCTNSIKTLHIRSSNLSSQYSWKFLPWCCHICHILKTALCPQLSSTTPWSSRRIDHQMVRETKHRYNCSHTPLQGKTATTTTTLTIWNSIILQSKCQIPWRWTRQNISLPFSPANHTNGAKSQLVALYPIFKSSDLTMKVLLHVYFMMIRPMLTYATLAWKNTGNTYHILLQRAQNRVHI